MLHNEKIYFLGKALFKTKLHIDVVRINKYNSADVILYRFRFFCTNL